MGRISKNAVRTLAVYEMLLSAAKPLSTKLVLNVGIKECSTCDINLRCEECVYQKENENIKSEIERLKIENQSLRSAANSYKLHYNEAKSEAIKEFTERLKDESFEDDGYYCDIVLVDDIDGLLKEMAGETE